MLEEFRKRGLDVFGPAIGLLAIIYFAYHAVHGDRGFLAWRHLEAKVAAREAVLAEIRGERQALEARVDRLRPESLDPDLLDETVRRVLGYGHPDDLVIATDAAR